MEGIVTTFLPNNWQRMFIHAYIKHIHMTLQLMFSDYNYNVQLVYEKTFLDKELSPAKTRAFFLPWIWEKRNIFGRYRLVQRIPKSASA